MPRVRRVMVGAIVGLVAVLGVARATTVVPSERVQESVTVRATPAATSAAVGTIEVGKSAELLGDVPRWYKVRLADGTEGYVSKAWTVTVETPSTPPPGPTPSPAPPPTPSPGPSSGAGIVFRPVSAVAQVPHAPPAPGAYRVHLIDVGTGLSVLVQGHDFTLLFDGGSNDDLAGISGGQDGDRLVAYLFAALGPSGPPDCVPKGDPPPPQADNPQLPIQHVVLSHPHRDHAALLKDVLHCYAVANVWESGAVNPEAFYEDFVRTVAADPDVTYHTATAMPADRTVPFPDGGVLFPASVTWTTFAEGTQQALGSGAHFTVLHVDPTLQPSAGSPDYNFNSVVLRVDLGSRSLLLTGDTTTGVRQAHTTPPTGAEQDLLAHHAPELHVDILQVAHHGSKTSTRAAFLAAVAPQIALIGAGPKQYGSVVLPDAEVVDALDAAGIKVLRTDDSDQIGCPTADRIGRDDSTPGGCDNWVLDIAP